MSYPLDDRPLLNNILKFYFIKLNILTENFSSYCFVLLNILIIFFDINIFISKKIIKILILFILINYSLSTVSNSNLISFHTSQAAANSGLHLQAARITSPP